MTYNSEEFDMRNIHPAADPYRGSPHKFSRIPLPSGAPRMPSAAELIAEADEIGFGDLTMTWTKAIRRCASTISPPYQDHQ